MSALPEIPTKDLACLVAAVRGGTAVASNAHTTRASGTRSHRTQLRIARAVFLAITAIFLHGAAFHAWSISPTDVLSAEELKMSTKKRMLAAAVGGVVVTGSTPTFGRDGCENLIVGWGDNSVGQTSWTVLRSLPLEIAAGYDHTVIRLADGSVECFGLNNHGQTRVPRDVQNVTRIAAGDQHTVALLVDQSVRCWGRNEGGQCNTPPTLGPVDAIAAGGAFTMARRIDGSLVLWGMNNYGQRDVPQDLGSVALMDGGVYHTIVATSVGVVRAWGRNDFGQTSVPPNLGSVIQVAGGDRHSAALNSDGVVYCWGQNWFGQCSVPAKLPPIIAIGLSDRYSLALDETGQVHRWGQDHGLPPTGTSLHAIAAGAYHGIGLVMTSDTVCGCPADIDESGVVNSIDLAAVLANWGSDGGKYPRADIDGDGTVSSTDLAAVLSAWGPCE